MKPTLKAPGSKHLTLKCGSTDFKFGFNFNLRRFLMLEQTGNMDSLILMMVTVLSSRLVAGWLAPHSFTDEVIRAKGYQAGAYTHPLLSST
jgi:hypothetical protein